MLSVIYRMLFVINIEYIINNIYVVCIPFTRPTML